MTVYVLAQLTIEDRDRYDRYAARFLATLEDHDGRLLAADETVAVVEGDWPYDKIILLEFPTAETFQQWATSPAYTKIAGERRAAATGPVILINSLHRTEDRR